MKLSFEMRRDMIQNPMIVADHLNKYPFLEDKTVLCKIPADHSIMFLLAAYYVFNIVYPVGLKCLYILFKKQFSKMKNDEKIEYYEAIV